MKPSLLSLAALLFAQWIVFMPNKASAADDPLPVFLCVDGSNMSGGRSKLEDLPKELKGEQSKALFFDGTQRLPLSAEKMNGRGFGSEVTSRYARPITIIGLIGLPPVNETVVKCSSGSENRRTEQHEEKPIQ